MKYGLIGCGAVGRVHAYHFSRNSDIEFECVADVDQKQIDRLIELFKKYDVPLPKRIYNDCKEMLEKEELDIVSIATPPKYHLEQVDLASQRGINILCEKPLATNYEDSKKIVSLGKERNVKIGVMLQRRANINTNDIRNAVSDGFFGKIENIGFNLRCYKPKEYYETWRGKKEFAGGGVLLSQSIHNIDQLIYMLGFNPVEVSCKTKITRECNDVEDEAKGIIRFDNGMQVEINASANSEEDWQCITEITGEDARIKIDSSKTLLWEIPLGFPELEESEDIPEEIKPNYYGPGHKKIIDDFVDSIANNRDPKFAVEDALLTMKVIFSMYESAENAGQTVRLDEL